MAVDVSDQRAERLKSELEKGVAAATRFFDSVETINAEHIWFVQGWLAARGFEEIGDVTDMIVVSFVARESK